MVSLRYLKPLFLTFLLTWFLIFTTNVSADTGIFFKDIKLKISYNTNYDKESLNELIESYKGEEIETYTLQFLLDDITKTFREQGFANAKAYLPEQTIDANGKVLIYVNIGKLKTIDIYNLTASDNKLIDNFMYEIVKQKGLPLNVNDVEKYLLYYKDLNAFEVFGGFRDLEYDDVLMNIIIEDKKKVEYGLVYDNWGTKATGEHRLYGALGINNVTHHADRLNLFYSRSNQNENNYSIGYELPIKLEDRPSVIGARICKTDYELGADYKELGAVGHAHSLDLSYKYPFFRNFANRLDISAGYELKHLEDRLDLFSLKFTKVTNKIYSSLSGFNIFDNFLLEHDAKLSYGTTSIKKDDFNIYEDSTFLIGNLDSKLSYNWNETTTLGLKFSGQLTSETLDGSESFNIGGAQAVRAYSSDVASGDIGFLSSFYVDIRPFNQEYVLISPHLDVGFVKNKHEKGVHLSGLGLEGQFRYKGLFANLSLDTVIFEENKVDNLDVDKVKLNAQVGFYL